MKLYFNVHYKPTHEIALQLVIQEKANQKLVHALSYADNGIWSVEVDYFSREICYYYEVLDADKNVIHTEPVKHSLHFPHNIKEFRIFDTWNKKNFPENYLNNKVFHHSLASKKFSKLSPLVKHTHWFRIEAPLFNEQWQMVIMGNDEVLGNWEMDHALPMLQTGPGNWEVAVEIKNPMFVQYKYAVQHCETKETIRIEYGDNRWALPNAEENVLYIKSDHHFRYEIAELYRAAGVAIPVFSLRSEKSFGVGEFADLKIFGDWAKACNISMIQTLPINDTTTDYTWKDNYPYSAISVYALHPQYLRLDELEFNIPENNLRDFELAREKLNAEIGVDYDQMIEQKWKLIKLIFDENKSAILKDRSFTKFKKDNEAWLYPYAAFCVQRDKYKTGDFHNWKTHKKYIAGKVAPVFTPKNKENDRVMLHCRVQYQLHIQLTDAVNYLHSLKISLKGDLPIGISRNSVEAWTDPDLFNLDFQTGAPPDQFSQLGQNWGFPTYNWQKMAEDGFQWWKNRFSALEQYFDAMRIDHILGFFRIWRIPVGAVQGIMGYFSPAIAVTEEEFEERGIPFDFDRYCKPYITNQILAEYFENEKDAVQNQFLNEDADGTFSFKPEFDNQLKIREYFEAHPLPEQEEKMLSLAANVLFLTEFRNGETVFHPRFFLYNTSSYHHLSDREKSKLYKLYNHYFFEWQDELWYESAMQKLPMLLESTDMLICAEDLGLVPRSVPEVMEELGITALKVQRMPADDIPYYDPRYAPYLNVVTTSTHDTSTLRQWWLEDRNLSVQYFHEQLVQKHGTAPGELVPALAEIILKQHLYNESMLAIFPLQDWLAADDELRNPDFEAERINIPANFPHNWNYRMHITVEQLLLAKEFNEKIAHRISDSGRK